MSTAASANPALPNSTVRSYALIGIVLYAFGIVLNRIGNDLSQFWLVPYADTVTALGFVVALYTATLAGLSTRSVVLIGLVYGVGTYFLGEPDSTQTASGLGSGLDHMIRIYIGLGLVSAATVILVALAYYRTRAKPGLPA